MNLITDRQASDLSLLDTLRKKIIARTATEAEWAQWNADLKAAYNASDLNRVIAAVEYLVDRLTSLGYQVDYTPIQFVRDVTLEPDSVVSGDEYDTYTYTAPGNGTYICSVPSGQEETISVSGGTIEVDLRMRQLVNYTMLYDAGDECVDVTRGWTGYGGSGTVTKGSNYLYGKTTTYNGACPFFVSTNAIPAQDYVLNFVKCKIVTNTHWANFGFGANRVTSIPYASLGSYSDSAVTCGGSVDAQDVVLLKSADITTTESEYAYACAQYGTRSRNRAEFYLYNWALFKADDWQNLCEKAGVTAPSTIAELIADSASIAAILGSEDAVKFMIAQCTGDFMASAIQSDVFLTALNASPYKTLVQGNEHWAKFLAMVA